MTTSKPRNVVNSHIVNGHYRLVCSDGSVWASVIGDGAGEWRMVYPPLSRHVRSHATEKLAVARKY